MSRAIRQALAGLICAAFILAATVQALFMGDWWTGVQCLALGAVIAAFIQPD